LRLHYHSHEAAAGILEIKRIVSTYKRLVNFLDTPEDNLELRGMLHLTKHKINQLVGETVVKLIDEKMRHEVVKDSVAKLKELGRLSSASKRLQKPIRHHELAKDFNEVVLEFQSLQKVAQSQHRSTCSC
jgi:hypothetical protein